MQKSDRDRFYPNVTDIPALFRLVEHRDQAQYLINGEILNCDHSTEVYSPICYKVGSNAGGRYKVGRSPMVSEEEGSRALNSAEKAYASGMGEWPQMSGR